jgi:CCR4-NOT transcription complex subunit 4
MCDGKLIRASFGTTKYCSYFLRGNPCINKNCLFLHEHCDDKFTLTKVS